MRTLIVVCALLGGCAFLQAPPPKPAAPLGPGEIVSAHAAEDALAVGSTTKSDVRAALGEAVVVDFPSGYEVWVYRQRPTEKPAAPGAELVLLFDPSGTLTKTRVR